MPRISHKTFDCAPGCPVEATLSIIGGKWKSVIIYLLLQNKVMRFNELRRNLPKITHRMLTCQLRDLENNGIIIRTIYAEVPPKVEYKLSGLGETLKPIIITLKEWGVEKYKLTKNATEN